MLDDGFVDLGRPPLIALSPPDSPSFRGVPYVLRPYPLVLTPVYLCFPDRGIVLQSTLYVRCPMAKQMFVITE